MHNQFDQYTKNLFREALSHACRLPQTEVEVFAATQRIDVYATPDPALAGNRKEMGLLGELASKPSLYEAFSSTPNLKRARRCINKQLTWYHELELQARAAKRKDKPKDTRADLEEDDDDMEAAPFPQLVMVSPGRPVRVLDSYMGRETQAGVYRLVPGLNTYVVVAMELPRTRHTLMLRLAGQGRVLYEAVEDLKKLPDDAWERCVAKPVLIRFQLDVTRSVREEGADMTAEMQAWFEDYQRTLRDEGRKLGVDEGERNLLLRQLHRRFGELPTSTVARIQTANCADLENWGERLLSAQTLDDVFNPIN